MAEMYDVLDDNGFPTGEVKTKEQIFSSSAYRLVTHAWVMNQKGELLAQRRAYQKGLWDGLWDVTVGGGVSSGEDTLNACMRELSEELGLSLSPSDLKLAGRYNTSKLLPERHIIAYEFSDTYITKIEINISDLVLQTEEVVSVEWVSLDEVGKDNQQRLWVPHPEEYYSSVQQKCRELL